MCYEKDIVVDSIKFRINPLSPYQMKWMRDEDLSYSEWRSSKVATLIYLGPLSKKKKKRLHLSVGVAHGCSKTVGPPNEGIANLSTYNLWQQRYTCTVSPVDPWKDDGCLPSSLQPLWAIFSIKRPLTGGGSTVGKVSRASTVRVVVLGLPWRI